MDLNDDSLFQILRCFDDKQLFPLPQQSHQDQYIEKWQILDNKWFQTGPDVPL